MSMINLSVAELKQLATPSLTDIYYTTDNGKEGEWKCMATGGHSPSEENTGTILIGNNGALYARVITGPIHVSWFKSGADWTQAIQNAVDQGKEIYFREGEYLISAPININSDKVLFGEGTLTKGRNGLAFFNFLQITGAETDVRIESLTFNGNLDPSQSHWKKAGEFAGKKQVQVDKASIFIVCQNIRRITLQHITCMDIHGTALHMVKVGNARIEHCSFVNIEGTQAVVMREEGELSVTDCVFDSVGLLPVTFFADGVSSDIDGVFFHQFGDAISAFNNRVSVSRNTFTNISRVSLAHDLNSENNYTDSLAIFEGNMITHNHHHLKNSNPPASVWCEQSKTAIISGNKIRYIRRHPMEDNTGYVITFTTTATYNNTKSIIADNIIECEDFNNRTYGGISVSDIHDKGQVIISNNILSGKMSNAILIGGSAASQQDTIVKICNNTLRIPDMPVEASCIRLEGAKPNMPTCIEITGNTFFSASDNATTTVPEVGKKVVTIGYTPAPFKLTIRGNNFNGGTAWLGNNNIDLVFENNIDTAIYHLPDFGTTVKISQNRFSKKVDLRGLKGLISGNLFADQLTLIACQDLIVADNEFRMNKTDQFILDVSYQSSARIIVRHNSFVLYQSNLTALHIKKNGAGIYASNCFIGNVFHGINLPSTFGFQFDAGTFGGGSFLADNRAVGITLLENGTSLNTNV